MNPCPSALFLVFVLLAASAPAAAWGRTGHRLVCELALKDLPPEVSPWLKGQERAFLEHSSDPDAWRKDRKEARRHYLHAESYGGPRGVPLEVGDAIRKIGAASFQKSGQVPWVIQDRLGDLVEAFRRRDRSRIAQAASVMGHYLADLHVPLHTTWHHDGQDSDQKGLHGRWESGLVERFVRLDHLPIQPASLEPDLVQAPWKWLDESHALVPDVHEDDNTADRTRPRGPHGKPRGQAYWVRFWELQGPAVNGQLSRAGHRLAQMILHAWVQAGRPALAASPQTSPR